jgi:hypothetical protein
MMRRGKVLEMGQLRRMRVIFFIFAYPDPTNCRNRIRETPEEKI